MHTFNHDGGNAYTIGRMERRRIGDIEMDEFVAMVRVTGHTKQEALHKALQVLHYMNGGAGYYHRVPSGVEQV